MLSYILQHFRAVYYFHAVKLSNGTKQGAKNGAFFLAEKTWLIQYCWYLYSLERRIFLQNVVSGNPLLKPV